MVTRMPFMVQLIKISNLLMVTSLPTHGTVQKKSWKMVKSGLLQLKMTNVHCLQFGGQARLSKRATSTTWRSKVSVPIRPIRHSAHKLRWTKQRLKFKSVLKNVLRVKVTLTGCVQLSKISWRPNQVGIQLLKILIIVTTCKVVPFSITTIVVQVMLTLTIVSWTAHQLAKQVNTILSILRIQVTVVSSSCWLMISTTQTQRFKLSSWTGSTTSWTSVLSLVVLKMKTLMVFVSMPWIMSMLTFSKLLQITSKLSMVLIKAKNKLLSTCLSWKHGLTMMPITMKTPKVLNCQWMTLCTWHWYIHSCVQLVTVQELNHSFQIV